MSQAVLPIAASDSGKRLSLRDGSGGWFLACAGWLTGCVLLALVHGTAATLVAAALLFLLGQLVNRLVGLGRPAEQRAFRLCFGVCLLVAGCVELYQTVHFGTYLSTSDSITFEYAIGDGEYISTLEEVRRYVDTPLPVIIWQTACKLCGTLLTTQGPWVPVLVNALVVAFSAALAVRTAREMFGDDRERLRYVGTICASCGMFWLFGALLLRDCFALLFMTLCLWACVRLLRVRSLVSAAGCWAVVIVSGIGMYNVREEAVYGIAFFALLGTGLSILRHRNLLVRFGVLAGALAAGALGFSYVLQYSQQAQELTNARREFYSEHSADSTHSQSLGLVFVVRQPLPIRIALGCLAVFVHPIPLWHSLYPGAGAYHILKNLHGLFMILIVPRAAAGTIIAFRDTLRGRTDRLPVLYTALMAGGATCLIAITSLETRHHGQFLPSLLLLAAVASNGAQDRRLIVRIQLGWILIVYAIHIAWLLLKLRS